MQTEIQVKLGEITLREEATRKEHEKALWVSINAKRSAKCKLLELPFELRKMILGYVVEPLNTAVYLPGNNGRRATSFPLPTVALLDCKLLRHEAITLVLQTSTIEIHSGPANKKVRAFLQDIVYAESGNTFGEDYKLGFDAVKSLNFPYFSCFPHAMLGPKAFNHDVLLACECKNLEKLALTWRDTETVDYGKDGIVPKPIAQLRREYRLDGLLTLNKLNTLRLVLRYTGSVGDVGYNQVRVLTEWFQEGFGRQGRVVAVIG